MFPCKLAVRTGTRSADALNGSVPGRASSVRVAVCTVVVTGAGWASFAAAVHRWPLPWHPSAVKSLLVSWWLLLIRNSCRCRCERSP